jgi:hypothetical protein
MHKHDWWGLEVVRVFCVSRGSHVIGSWGREEVLVHIGYQRFAYHRVSKIALRVDWSYRHRVGKSQRERCPRLDLGSSILARFLGMRNESGICLGFVEWASGKLKLDR